MPNTTSAKKAVRSSTKKRDHNLFWKGRIKRASKTLQSSIDTKVSDEVVLKEQLTSLQKVVDKAVKHMVISKNRANRLKSKYAKKTAAPGGEISKKKTAPKKKAQAK